jgi:hypothetical protein
MTRVGINRYMCWILVLAGAAAYAGDRGLSPELVGGMIDLDTGETSNMGGVSAAYNSTDNEYRVVWFDSRIAGQNDVYAQRVTAYGELIGTNVTIISGSNSQTDTGAAYNPTSNEYLITWKNQSDGPGSPGFNHTFGGIASATGGLIGGEVDLSNAGLEPTLVYNSIENQYFLEARNFAGGGTAGIYAKRIAANGSPIGADLTITTSGAPAPAGQMAYNVNGNQYLATWRDQSAESLKGRIVNANGTFATAPFVISSMFPESGLAAGAAFDPTNDRYLVVFSEFCASGVYGQFVSSSGTLDGSVFTIVEAMGARLTPVVAYDGVNDAFLVVWINNDTGKLTAQLLYDDGALAGDPLPIDNPGAAAGVPCIATNTAEGRFIIAWADHKWETPGQHDILGQIIGVTSETPCPDLDGDGDVDLADLAQLLAHYGTTSGATFEDGDIDGDGDVDLADLAALLAEYGTTCE